MGRPDRALDRRPLSSGATTVDIASEGADFSEFAATWEALYATSDNEPSTSLEWTTALLRHHARPGDRTFLLRMARRGVVIALVPLVAQRRSVVGVPITILSPIEERYNTHRDILSSELDAEAVNTLLASIFKLGIEWDVFRLSNLLENHPLLRYADRRTVPCSFSSYVRDGGASYFLELPRTFDAYLAQRSAKFRNHLRRTEKKIEVDHSVRVDTIASPDEVERGFEDLLAVERASWKHPHGTAISAVPRQIGFYRDLCRGAAVHGHLHLHCLYFGDDPVAYDLGYVRNGVYSYLKTSYVETHRSIGVATYLRAHLVRQLIDDGIRVLDFPAEPYEWERQWTATVRWHKVLTLYRTTPAGIGVALADRLRHRSQRDRSVDHRNPRDLVPKGRGADQPRS